MSLTELDLALEAFKDAVADLSEAWSDNDAEAIKNYPRYLPSFDEFEHDIIEMEVRQ